MSLYDPIRIGSGISGLTPQPGFQITTNEFNVDECTLEFFAGSPTVAAANRPARGDSYSGSISALSGFKVHDSSLLFDDGASCVISVIYKKPRFDLAIAPVVDTDLKVAGTTIADIIKIPEATVSRRYPSTTRPDSIIGDFKSDADGFSLGFPRVTSLWPAWTTLAGTWDLPQQWRNVKFSAEAQCVAAPYSPYFFQVTEIWKAYANHTPI